VTNSRTPRQRSNRYVARTLLGSLVVAAAVMTTASPFGQGLAGGQSATLHQGTSVETVLADGGDPRSPNSPGGKNGDFPGGCAERCGGEQQ
jgi:hypothetical protein